MANMEVTRMAKVKVTKVQVAKKPKVKVTRLPQVQVAAQIAKKPLMQVKEHRRTTAKTALHLVRSSLRRPTRKLSYGITSRHANASCGVQ